MRVSSFHKNPRAQRYSRPSSKIAIAKFILCHCFTLLRNFWKLGREFQWFETLFPGQYCKQLVQYKQQLHQRSRNQLDDRRQLIMKWTQGFQIKWSLPLAVEDELSILPNFMDFWFFLNHQVSCYFWKLISLVLVLFFPKFFIFLIQHHSKLAIFVFAGHLYTNIKIPRLKKFHTSLQFYQ